MSTQRPNFLVIMTEQHRGDCLSIAGHPVLMTPNMDAIAGGGVRFDRAYSTCPTCIAARRSFLSGQSPSTHGMMGYRDDVEWAAPTTIAGALAREGYQTAWVGRSMHQHPRDRRFGFEYVVQQNHYGDSDYMNFIRSHRPDDWEGAYGSGVMHNDWTARPWHLDEDLHPTNWTVHEALRFLRDRDDKRPFFLVVSFLAAHPPLVPPAFYMERYIRTGVDQPVIGGWAIAPADGGRGMDVASRQVDLRNEALLCARAGYYGLLNHVDDQIRRMINPITGVDPLTGNNTVVMLTSDHGEMLGDHYRWGKTVPYEPSVRIPMLLRAPARFGLQAGKVIHEPVCLEDVMPTVLDMAGAAIPDTVEGRSMLPLMRGQATSWRPYVHIEYAPMHHTLTDGKEKYVWFPQDGHEQFFDLVTDPTECRDLSGADTAATRLQQWRGRMVEELKGRPEGFSDGKKLIPGRPYPTVRTGGGASK